MGTVRGSSWLAAASLGLAGVGFLAVLYAATPHAYRSGDTARALLILVALVLPCGLVGLVLGSAAILRQSARNERQGLALAGLLLSGMVVVLSFVGFAVVGFAAAD